MFKKKFLLIILLSMFSFSSCTSNSNLDGEDTFLPDETTLSSAYKIEESLPTTVDTIITTEETTPKVYEKRSLYDIMLTLPQNPPVGKPATQMTEQEILSVGNDVTTRFRDICYKYFSCNWSINVKTTPNTDKNIEYPNICELDEYESIENFAKVINDCMTTDAFYNVEGDCGYIEINGLIYRYDYAYGWPYSSKCHLTSYRIIDDNTIEFIFDVDEDPNEEAHQCSFIAKNIGGWKVSTIDLHTGRTIMYQYVCE